ncbi:alanine--tRNA ligase [Aquaspirillum soli]
MKAAEIRRKFLDFFASKGHQIVSSSSLVPHDDPTLLFTNAGMNQFKDVFLGFDKRPYTRATTSQKCVRAGGKHNDLENVGYTARHHTFFEMLGNFSFGDYFKRDAIHYAWEFLTSPAWLNLPKDKLMVTVYATDDEAYAIWHEEIGVPAEKIVRIGDNKGAPYASDNFWQMGDTGPCGPCTEIFYDHGAHIWGGPPGSPEEDGDRFIEIWNNVFMQFNRTEDGVMHPLPKPSVDTGMGLERISAVLQGVHANYEIDLFQNLLQAAAREVGVPFSMDVPSLKVIADHIRACSFLIADGVMPSNDGRGYVLRRIIRRAIRHGYKLGQKQPFFHRLVQDLVNEMGDAYPELRQQQAQIEDALKQEEVKFAETLENGMALLEAALANQATTLDGATAFKLYDTYGFPLDLTADICREREVTIDQAGFDAAMEAQRALSRAASSFKTQGQLEYSGSDTRFEGYDSSSVDAHVLALYKDGQAVNSLSAGDQGVVVLDCTAFYAEGGGQVGDRGEIVAAGGVGALFDVVDTQKVTATAFGHHGTLARGQLQVGDSVQATIDLHARRATERNHSATHLLHAALREVLGKHVQQKGSLVNHERTRFDFAHTGPVTADELADIERVVNRVVCANYAVDCRLMKHEDAIKAGAMALFGEKYGDEVRVLKMGEFSTELCGGTHVERTGDIGLFKIVTEAGVAAGVRRIEAVTGEAAVAYVQAQDALLRDAANQLKAQSTDDVGNKIHALQDHAKALEKEIARLKGKLASSMGDELAAQAQEIQGVKVLAVELDGADSAALRETMDKLKDKLKSAVIVLASRSSDKVQLAAGATADVCKKVKAGELVNFVAAQVGGKGGGKPDMAMAGGTEPAKLPAALASVADWVNSQLAKA